jgi:pimeloyl-ACP methyl ester carboxylesterase
MIAPDQPGRTGSPSWNDPRVDSGTRDDGELGLVFVHGAGLGGWIWEAMAPELEFPYLFTDFPERHGTVDARTHLGLDDYVRHVRKQVDGFPVGRLALVAHSLGGVVALRLAAGLGDRVAAFAGVGAAIPPDGGSFLSSLPLPKRAFLSVAMRVAGTKPPASALRSGQCNDLDDQATDEVVRRFQPESRAVYFERVDATVPEVARIYVHLTEDREFGSALQRGMAQNLGAGEVTEIATGHLPMLSKPDELARILNQFASAAVTN